MRRVGLILKRPFAVKNVVQLTLTMHHVNKVSLFEESHMDVLSLVNDF